MSTRAVDAIDSDLATACHCDTIVLVVDLSVLEGNVVTLRNIEAIAVMSSRVIATSRVGLVTSGVIE